MFLPRVTGCSSPSGLGGHSVGYRSVPAHGRAEEPEENLKEYSCFCSPITLRGCHTSAKPMHATWISGMKSQVG